MVISFDITGHNVIKIEIRVIVRSVPSVHNKILSDDSSACHLRGAVGYVRSLIQSAGMGNSISAVLPLINHLRVRLTLLNHEAEVLIS